jgi:hypothetical protein
MSAAVRPAASLYSSATTMNGLFNAGIGAPSWETAPLASNTSTVKAGTGKVLAAATPISLAAKSTWYPAAPSALRNPSQNAFFWPTIFMTADIK